MQKLIRLSLVIGGSFIVLCLASCWDHKPSYAYLMLHPDQLQKAYNKCVEEVADPSLPCQTIMRAQADFTILTNQREQDPEQFGAQVLQTEENVMFLKSKFEETLQAYQALGAGHPTLEDLKARRIQVDKAQRDYKNSLERMKIFLSVIAATSSV